MENSLTKSGQKYNELTKNDFKERRLHTEMNNRPYYGVTNLSVSPTKIQMKESILFKSLKEKTHQFFKNSKIESCSHVLVKNGQTLAIPYNIVNQKGNGLTHYKTIPMKSSELMSIYRKDYSIKPHLHCGMKNKPLEPYNPTSYRSRLPNTDYVISHKNKSSFEIGNPNTVSRKQWVSTTKDYYQTPVFLPICNTGILSDNAKKVHSKLISH